MRVSSFLSAIIAIVHAAAIVISSQPEIAKIRSAETIVLRGRYSFPEKLALDRFGNLYLLDSQLSNVFVVHRKRTGQEIKALCSPRTPIPAADLSVERTGGIWILDSRGSQIVKLDRNCKVEKSVTPRRAGLAVEVNSAGELIVLTSTGSDLFDLYDQTGNFLQSFGRRISYGDPISDGELNNGHVVADRSGGFYFSFNYPPLVQHYRRDGKLIGEFKPPSDVHIGPANVGSVIHRKWVQAFLLVALFAISAGITLFAVERWARRENPPATQQQGSLENIPGLSKGEWIRLPKLPSLERGEVDLSKTEQKHMLCVFISTDCAGCSQDEPFWKALRNEMSGKQVAFYVIAVDAEQAKVENFAQAYEFKDLLVLFDPQRHAIEAFKISFVPQYVLLGTDGFVLGRWNGIQRFDPKQSTAIDKLKGLGERLSGPTE